jgi:hypothetical protein
MDDLTGKYKTKSGRVVEIKNGLDSDGEDVADLIADGTLMPVSQFAAGNALEPPSASSSWTPSSSSAAPGISSMEEMVDFGGGLAFPLGSAAKIVKESLPEGTAKELVGKYGIPVGAGIDAGLNAATVAGIGAPAKAASVGVLGAASGLTKILPNAIRKGAEFIASKNPFLQKSLTQLSNGAITGEKLASMSTKTKTVKEWNLLEKAAELEDARAFKGKAARIIKAKGEAATPAEHARYKELYKERAVINRELNGINEKISDVGKAINKDIFGEKSAQAIYSPFFPDAAAAAGHIGQRAGGTYLGASFLADLLKPEGKFQSLLDSTVTTNR